MKELTAEEKAKRLDEALAMAREDNIIIPRWFLENVENTLRIQNNINLDKKTGETCQDRNIRESLNGVRKLLNGEELTGMERLEKLSPLLGKEDERIRKWLICYFKEVCDNVSEKEKKGIIAWLEKQGEK